MILNNYFSRHTCIVLFNAGIFVLSCFVAVFGFYWSSYNINVSTEDYYSRAVENAESTTLYIGITSCPGHEQQRQSLRDTWLQLLPHSFHYRFLVGAKICNIHPSDRTSQYGCDGLNFVIPENVRENSILNSNSIDFTSDKHLEAAIGFDFHVHHPITVHFLGVMENVLIKTDAELARVELIDLTSSSKIATVTFSGDSLSKYSYNNGYIFKKLINPVILPKGFEGSLKVKGLVGDKHESCRMSTKWNHGNLFSVFNVITRNSSTRSNSSCLLSTFRFSIRDLYHLREHIAGKEERNAKWLLYIYELSDQVQLEAARYKDILFLDMVDVYRNLPLKVLLFLKWVYKHHRVQYVLKTDDDTFIDISTVKLELDKHSEWDWWSCFRIGWPVHTHGKWHETVYQHQTYPPFPSGAGYILSKNSLRWLNTRADNLSTKYQGEDVAMGIWLEAFNGSRHIGEVCYWACSEQCHVQTCNAMQLSVQDIYKMWEYYRSCGNKICYCPER